MMEKTDWIIADVIALTKGNCPAVHKNLPNRPRQEIFGLVWKGF